MTPHEADWIEKLSVRTNWQHRSDDTVVKLMVAVVRAADWHYRVSRLGLSGEDIDRAERALRVALDALKAAVES